MPRLLLQLVVAGSVMLIVSFPSGSTVIVQALFLSADLRVLALGVGDIRLIERERPIPDLPEARVDLLAEMELEGERRTVVLRRHAGEGDRERLHAAVADRAGGRARPQVGAGGVGEPDGERLVSLVLDVVGD